MQGQVGQDKPAANTCGVVEQHRRVALQLNGVTKEYGEFTLGPVHLEIPQGSIMGLVGANGAGKTTLTKMVLGLVHPTAGSMFVAGERVDTKVGCPLNVAAALENGPYGAEWSPKAVRSYMAVADKNFDNDQFTQLCQHFGLPEKKSLLRQPAAKKMMLGVATALARSTELIVLDEPTADLDPAARVDLLRTVRQVAHQQHRSVVMSSQVGSDIESVCDTVTILVNGDQAGSGTVAELIAGYRVVSAADLHSLGEVQQFLIGIDRQPAGCAALIKAEHARHCDSERLSPASLDQILAHLGWHARRTLTVGDQ